MSTPIPISSDMIIILIKDKLNELGIVVDHLDFSFNDAEFRGARVWTNTTVEDMLAVSYEQNGEKELARFWKRESEKRKSVRRANADGPDIPFKAFQPGPPPQKPKPAELRDI